MKYVIDINEDVPYVLFQITSNADFVYHIKELLERGGDKEIKDNFIPEFEDYLRRCRNQQKITIILSDELVTLEGTLDEVRPKETFLDNEDMKIE